MAHGTALMGFYDYRLVAVSVVIAILAAYAALDLAGRVTAARGTIRFAWLSGGALAMGLGIWSMHYVGMEAMRLSVPVKYDWPTVLLSMVAAVLASAIALFVVSRKTMGLAIAIAGSILMGAGIAAMHYLGMAAMRLPAMSSYSPGLVALSVAVAIVISFVAMKLSFGVRDQMATASWRKSGSALAMGLAIPVMHYIGMAAVSFRPAPLPASELTHAIDISAIALAGIGLATLQLLAVAIVASILDRHRLVELQDNMQRQSRSRELLASIVEFSEDAIIGKDNQGIVTSWNAAAQKIFGYRADEMIGQSIARLLPEDRANEETELLNRIRRGEAIEHLETHRKAKNGKLIYVSLTISPLRDAAGKVVGASKIARDITATRQLERQLQQSQKMEAVGQLTGGIAHDFNNLLAVIVGNLSLVERMVGDNAMASKRLQTAQKAAARGADLTGRLLAFSSSETLKPVPTVLADSIRNTIELAARTLGPEIKITTKLGENIPAVFVDPAGLESALLNLAVNARDAMPRGGSLTITSQLVNLKSDYPPVEAGELKPGRYASVSVTDSGLGMSRETLERALEPFFTTKPRGKGTGLGLAMVYGFVKQSGGIVRLYSEIGYGTTVTFYLQLAQGETYAVEETGGQAAATALGGKVLVVDDEVDLLDIACCYLEEMGYTVFQATDGASALEMIERERDIDLVVTDVIMPGGMNGVELVRRIRQRLPDIKAIYSSGFPADALSERSGTEMDALLLGKPYQREEFETIIRRTFDGIAATASR